MSYSISLGTRIHKSPFYEATLADGVKAFSVYNHTYMPTSFGDPLGEYWRLINEVSMWDVACERQVEISGPDAGELIQYLTPRDLSNCQVGQGKYVPICNHDGWMINDPVLLRVEEDRFWLSIADSDILLWAEAIAGERGMDVTIVEPDVSPLAIQGPLAEDATAALLGDWVRDLKYFWFRDAEVNGIPLIVAKSGWSKQGGYELYLRDGSRGGELWKLVREAGEPFGIAPGSPNPIERIESGLLSFGNDTHPRATPFEVGLGAYVDVDLDVDFIGKAALRRAAAQGPRRTLTGIVWQGTGLTACENHWPVSRDGGTVGLISAAAHSPRMQANIAVGLVETDVVAAGQNDGETVRVIMPHCEAEARLQAFPLC